MPLPNFGYDNQEKKTHQDIVFEMAPEIVSDDDETVIVNGKKVKRVRGKVSWWHEVICHIVCSFDNNSPLTVTVGLNHKTPKHSRIMHQIQKIMINFTLRWQLEKLGLIWREHWKLIKSKIQMFGRLTLIRSRCLLCHRCPSVCLSPDLFIRANIYSFSKQNPYMHIFMLIFHGSVSLLNFKF